MKLWTETDHNVCLHILCDVVFTCQQLQTWWLCGSLTPCRSILTEAFRCAESELQSKIHNHLLLPLSKLCSFIYISYMSTARFGRYVTLFFETHGVWNWTKKPQKIINVSIFSFPPPHPPPPLPPLPHLIHFTIWRIVPVTYVFPSFRGLSFTPFFNGFDFMSF